MVREPFYRSTPIGELRPTQITVGLQEVAAKLASWKKKHGEKAGEFLATHMIPVVLGPQNQRYVTDHHHLARALYEAGVRQVATSVVLDLHRLEEDAFWVVLDNRGLMHPFDAHGQRQDYSKIPGSIAKLVDDPYRSLAGALRRAGGYAKDTTPFSEFLWADFLRRRIKRGKIVEDFDRALAKAVKLAKSEDADYLPGWCGKVED